MSSDEHGAQAALFLLVLQGCYCTGERMCGCDAALGIPLLVVLSSDDDDDDGVVVVVVGYTKLLLHVVCCFFGCTHMHQHK
jgi:hypothetical protein